VKLQRFDGWRKLVAAGGVVHVLQQYPAQLPAGVGGHHVTAAGHRDGPPYAGRESRVTGSVDLMMFPA
jgi:hypothetical protein